MDSVHPPSPAGWEDIPPPRVRFMRINTYGAHRGPFDLPFGDLMKKEGFSGILNVLTRRLLFNISFLPPAPQISMEYNVLIFSLGNLMILLIEKKSLLFVFNAKESAIYTNLARSMPDDILRSAAPYPLNIYVYALRTSLDWYIRKVKSKSLVFCTHFVFYVQATTCVFFWLFLHVNIHFP